MPVWYQDCRSGMVILQAVIAAYAFCYAYSRRDHFSLRLFFSTALGFLLANTMQQVIYVPGNSAFAIVTHALVSLMNFFIVVIVFLLCLNETIWTMLLGATAACTAQSMGGLVKNLLKLSHGFEALANDRFGILIVDFIAYGGLYLLLFALFRPFTRRREEDKETKSKAIVLLLILVFRLAMSWLTQTNNSRNALSIVVENVYGLLVGFLVLALQYGVMERGVLSTRVELLNELVYQQRAQYEASKESAELINEKYHDLKSLLQSFRGCVPGEQLHRLERSIDRYDLHIDTGNPVLNVLLTEKMDLCVQRGIDLTCCVRQADLSFIEELDLYELFQNALNNAVNAVSALPLGQERFIILSASREGNLVSIHTENPCLPGVDFHNGLPQTKGDPREHGFGMKSMVRVADKYEGTVTAALRNGLFLLDILLLNPQSSQGHKRA